jgi:hypothetical protein
MTELVFQDALLNCYANKMEKYYLENNTPFKIFLIVDNAPRHPHFIGDLHPNIKVVFLTPNTTSWIQRMDQGVIAAFKVYYLSRTLAQAIAATAAIHRYMLKLSRLIKSLVILNLSMFTDKFLMGLGMQLIVLDVLVCYTEESSVK